MPPLRTRYSPHAAASRLVLIPFLAFVLTLLGCGGGGSAPSNTTTVSVDFSQAVPVKSMVGFLHSMSSGGPTDALVAPLQPKLWRSGVQSPQIYPRATGFGAAYVLVCSDFWGYDPHNRPDSNFPAYQAEVEQLTQQYQSKNVIYDIWNEPDGVAYWSASQDAYFQTFKIAHDAIRSVQPDALISGPSDDHYDHDAIQLFLKFCLKEHIRLDVLSWHEFESGSDIPSIQAHLEEARQDFLDDPEFAPLGIKQIQINEAIHKQIQYEPASSLAVLDRLERGGADAAAHACWVDPVSGSNCSADNLDGLLTTYYDQPRAVWWAFKAYADGVATRVASASTNSRFVSLASRSVVGLASATPAPQVIVGMYAVPSSSDTGTATLVLNHLSGVPSLARSASLRLTIETIPRTEGDPLPGLPPTTTLTVPVQNDSATVALPVALEEVSVVSLAPA